MFSVAILGTEDVVKTFGTFEEAKEYLVKLQNEFEVECPHLVGKFHIIINDKVVY